MPNNLQQDFDDIAIDLFEKQPERKVKTNIIDASSKDPDKYAESYNLAKKNNLPVETVENNLDEVKKKDRQEDFNEEFDNSFKDSPEVFKFLEDRDNANLAYDDLNLLQKTEKTFNKFGSALKKGFAAGDATSQLGRVSLEQNIGVRDFQPAQKEIDRLSDIISDDPGRDGFINGFIFPGAKFVGQMADNLEGAFYAGAGTAGIAAIAGQAGPQVLLPEELVTVPAAFAFGSVSYLASQAFVIEAGHTYEAVKEIEKESGQKVEPLVKHGVAAFVGVANASLEMVGLKYASAPLRGAIKKYLSNEGKDILVNKTKTAAIKKFATEYTKAMAAETTTEVLQEVVNIVAEEYAGAVSIEDFQGKSSDENISRLLHTMTETMRGMAILGAGGPGVSLHVDYAKARKAKKNKELMIELGEDAQNSKLLQRAPEKFREFVSKVKGNVESVYFDVEDFQTYFQSKDLDPNEVAVQLGVESSLEEAKLTGGSIEIPLENYAEKMAATEYHQDLIETMKFAPDDMTSTQADEIVNRGINEVLQEQADLATELEAKEKADAAPSERVFGEVRDELRKAGRSFDVAEKEALLYQSFFRTLSEKTGTDAYSLYKGQNLSIKRELPESVRAKNINEQDLALEELRSYRGISDKKAFGDSLIQHISKKGGINPNDNQSGDLLGMDLDKYHTNKGAFTKKVFQDTGKFLDDIALTAWEDGYFPELASRPTIEDLVSKIDQELRGEIQYSEQQGNLDLQEKVKTLDELDQFLNEIGADINTMTNQEIKDLIADYRNGVETDISNKSDGQETQKEVELEIEKIIKAENKSKVTVEELEKPEPEFKPEVKPEPIKVEAPIEDFGEKIHGAKKDAWIEYSAILDESLPEDLSKVTLAKYFPEPKYETLIANGADVKVLAAIKAIRDEIPSKPRRSYKLKRWAEQVESVRGLSNDLLLGNLEVDELVSKMNQVYTSFDKRIDLYSKLGYPAFTNAKDWSIGQGKFSFYNTVKYDPPKTLFHVQKGRDYGKAFETEQEAITYLTANLLIKPDPQKKVTKLDIYQVMKTGEVVIGKKTGSRKYIKLRGGFTNVKDARAFLKENEQSLQELLAKKKEVAPTRKGSNSPRVGEDHRMGQNISPERFASEFGFRGVQFGNYVEQTKRAEDLNNSYDALLDLADIINVPSRALSLNGELALAFGARGRGGKNAASAHYEEKNTVINLTKNSGAGSLGHEWWHSLDNYFGKKQGEDFITNRPRIKKVVKGDELVDSDAVRPEVAAAYKEVMKAIKESDLPERSLELDKKKTKDYWSTDIEMSARAFETYLISKAKEKGYSNDYLANVLDEEVSDVSNKMAADLGMEKEPYAYPTEKEMGAINKAFDKLFETLQTRKTEKGLEFFQSTLKTDSKEFKEWFGDSKVVDEKGEPLVVYHGTDKNFNTFNNTKNNNPDIAGWFTSNKEVAEAFTTELQTKRQIAKEGIRRKKGARLLAVYLKADNLLIAEGGKQITLDELSKETQIKFNKELIEEKYKSFFKVKDVMALDGWLDLPEITNAIKNEGYNGIRGKGGQDLLIVFEPNQIKSVNNQGSFSPESDNIFFQSSEDKQFIDAEKFLKDTLPTGDIENTRGFLTHDGQVLEMDFFSQHDLELKNAGLPDASLASFTEYGVIRLRNAWDGKTGQQNIDISAKPTPQQIKSLKDLSDDTPIFFDFKNKDEAISSPVEGVSKKQFFKQINTFFKDEEEFFQKTGDKRGSFTTGQGEKMIKLFEQADLSTFLHESGHFFLEVMGETALQENAPQEVVDDFNNILKFLEVDSIENIKVEQHEKFARAFEAYLFEGKAPSVELSSAFSRFKAWLIGVYKNISKLNVELDDNIRGVFDRMLATKEEIENAESLNAYAPILTAENSGMNPEEYQNYLKSAERATEKSETELLKKTMNEIRRERLKTYKDEKARVRDQVEEDLMQNPTNQALYYLQNGDIFKGEVSEDLKGLKLDTDKLKEDYGSEVLKFMPKSVPPIYKKGGVNPDIVADIFGFDSGDALVKSLWNSQNLKGLIEESTEVKMKERHGDILNDGSIQEEALKVIHNDDRANFLATELEALGRRVGRELPSAKRIAQGAAKRFISELKIKDLKLGKYSAAEVKAAKLAQKAVSEGNFGQAVEQKRLQLFNHYVVVEGRKAETQVDKSLKYLAKFNKKDPRAKIGKAGGGYLEQIDQLLENYELKRATTLRRLKSRESLLAFVEGEKEKGNPINIAQEIIEQAAVVNYKQVATEKFFGLVDSIKNIEHLARFKGKLLINEEKRSIREIAQEIESITGQHKKFKEPAFDPETKKERAKSFIRGLGGAVTKIQTYIEGMDGGEKIGAIYQYLKAPLDEASNNRSARMVEESDKFLALMTKYYGKKSDTKLDKIKNITSSVENITGKKLFIASVGQSLNLEQRLTVAFNWGNPDSRQKLLVGHKWSQRQVEEILDTLEKNDWDFVQETWDYIDSFWPESVKLEKELTGVSAPKLDSSPVNTKYGIYKGGYFPMKYSNRIIQDEKYFQEMKSGGFNSTSVSRSFQKERVKPNSDMKVSLSGLGTINSHISEIVNSLTMGRAVHGVNKLLKDRRIKNTIEGYLSPEAYQDFELWLGDIASSGVAHSDAASRIVRNLRSTATIGAMGLKVTTTIIQVSGFAQSIVEVGPKNMLSGFRAMFAGGKPWEVIAQIQEKSIFMRDRSKTFNRDINDTMKAFKGEKLSSDLIKVYFYPIAKMQQFVDIPTWLAGYKGALKDGKAEKQAIQAGDLAVENSQGTGLIKGLSPIERGSLSNKSRFNEFVKLFTTFYSYFNTKLNLVIRETQNTNFKKPMDVLKLSSNYLALFWLEALIGDLILGRLPDFDDDEPDQQFANYSMKLVLGQIAGTLPLAREVASGMQGFDAAPGGIRGLTDVARGLKTVSDLTVDVWSDEEIDGYKTAMSLLSLGNVASPVKLPTGQINTTLDAIRRQEKGEDVEFIEFFLKSYKK